MRASIAGRQEQRQVVTPKVVGLSLCEEADLILTIGLPFNHHLDRTVRYLVLSLERRSCRARLEIGSSLRLENVGLEDIEREKELETIASLIQRIECQWAGEGKNKVQVLLFLAGLKEPLQYYYTPKPGEFPPDHFFGSNNSNNVLPQSAQRAEGRATL